MIADFLEVGVVKALNRFPVKSMRGERLQEAHVYWHGLDGDRRYAFVRGDDSSGFPWLTGRQVPQMVLYTPRFTEPANVIQSPIVVETPNGRSLHLTSPDLQAELAQAYGGDVRLIKIGRGVYDSQVLSLISTATVQALSAAAGLPVESGRFRQNVIIDAGERPFVEEAWLDGVLTFGARPDSPRIRLNRRIQRCQMINIDPNTGEKDARVLKTVAAQRDSCAGVYASTEKPGWICTGDVVRLMLES